MSLLKHFSIYGYFRLWEKGGREVKGQGQREGGMKGQKDEKRVGKREE